MQALSLVICSYYPVIACELPLLQSPFIPIDDVVHSLILTVALVSNHKDDYAAQNPEHRVISESIPALWISVCNLLFCAVFNLKKKEIESYGNQMYLSLLLH